MKYFWNREYRHHLRTLRPSLQNEVKKTFKEFGLKLNETSNLHLDLILEIVGDYTIQGEEETKRKERLDYSYNWTSLELRELVRK